MHGVMREAQMSDPRGEVKSESNPLFEAMRAGNEKTEPIKCDPWRAEAVSASRHATRGWNRKGRNFSGETLSLAQKPEKLDKKLGRIG